MSYGRHNRQHKRDRLTSTYTGIPACVVRTAGELWHRLNGREVNYLRAPWDEDERQRMRGWLLAAARSKG